MRLLGGCERVWKGGFYLVADPCCAADDDEEEDDGEEGSDAAHDCENRPDIFQVLIEDLLERFVCSVVKKCITCDKLLCCCVLCSWRGNRSCAGNTASWRREYYSFQQQVQQLKLAVRKLGGPAPGQRKVGIVIEVGQFEVQVQPRVQWLGLRL